MIRFTRVAGWTLSFLFSVFVQAGGGMEGGGGQGVLCTAANGSRTLEPLDIYEAKNVWGYTIPAGGTLKDAIQATTENYIRLWDSYTISATPPVPIQEDFDQLEVDFNYLQSRFQAIPSGSRLVLQNDYGGLLLQPPPNCQLVQILFYVDEGVSDGKILVDNDYWNLLTPQSKLAFYFHEILYKIQRDFGSATSKDIRKVVGLIFHRSPYPGPLSSMYGVTESQFCYMYSSDIIVSFFATATKDPRGIEMTRLAFTNLDLNPKWQPLLVETLYDAYIPFRAWKAGTIQTSDQGYTRSVLGSRLIQVGVKPGCAQSGKCPNMFGLYDPASKKWFEGEIECRDKR